MVARIFGAMVLMVVLGSWTFGAVVGANQDRVIAATLAPLWAAALRAELARPQGPAAPPGGRAPAAATDRAEPTRDVSITVEMRRGEPPASAYSISSDARIRALVEGLRDAGIGVREVRLDDALDPPITWLSIQHGPQAERAERGERGERHWVGLRGGVQPAAFRQRVWMALAALLALVLVTAWFVSRWVARPLAALSQQIDQIGRGELPERIVRGAREIEHVGETLMAMAHQRAAFESDRRLMLMGISHDLRSPLTRIRVAADLLGSAGPAGAAGASGSTDSEPLRALIVRNIEQADAVIDNFADYVRAESEPLAEQVDLVPVVRAVAATVELPPAQLHLPSTPVLVRGHGLLLRRLLRNLIDNAEQHGAPPVEIRLEVQDAMQVTLAVEDAGPGIADPERMVRPFERGDAARQSQGSGLGLALVARVAERHRGRLVFGRSARGGARVAVVMPLSGQRASGPG
jgi:two-component system, OmpR family, osmolarity sensor histidine kinase EnvZ